MTQDEVIEMLCNQYHACQDHNEIAWFWKNANKINPKVVVEIGIFAGGDLKVLSTLVKDPNGLVVGLEYDWFEWKKGGWDLNQNICPVKLIDGDTHLPETLEKLKEILGGRQIDVLMIDGDHGYAGVKKDHEMYGPLVRSGGIIGFHDLWMKRQKHEAEDFFKCGEYWDDLYGEKFSYFSDRHDRTGYGIGYIIKQ